MNEQQSSSGATSRTRPRWHRGGFDESVEEARETADSSINTPDQHGSNNYPRTPCRVFGIETSDPIRQGLPAMSVNRVAAHAAGPGKC